MKNSPFFSVIVTAAARCRSLALVCVCLMMAGACGTLHPVPETFVPQDYSPIGYQDLLDPGRAGLHDGQKVRVQALYWQTLAYEPAVVRNYLTLPRYPIRWYRLRWFATYGSEEMKGYFDLAAMTPEQESRYQLHRLDPVVIYGEMSALRPGLFLLVHHIEKIPPE